MGGQPAIELSGVTKSFGTQTAVDALDLSVPEGSIYGFIGPNGSGKTTTMRMILRIYRPDSGEVTVLGTNAGNVADERIGYLPEERGLYRRMTVRQVLRYFARLKGIRRPDKIIDEQLEKMGAQTWHRKKIEQLSKGMAQKIQFIVAVIAQPELVLLDEPFSGLDPVNMEVLRDSVLDLRKRGTTVIFSTHDMEMAERLCDRVVMIHKGKKVLDGTLESIKSGYGGNVVRVRTANDAVLPEHITGVTQSTTHGRSHDLQLDDEQSRRSVLSQLAETLDIEYFETIRPSLHDIFVRIVKQQAEGGVEQPA
jgi:ABC-2 type transport system ATP-binding protein